MLRVRVTPEELRAIESAARGKKQSVSEWIRETIRAAIK
jgi:predicted HicB family RNase H-like nuclease